MQVVFQLLDQIHSTSYIDLECLLDNWPQRYVRREVMENYKAEEVGSFSHDHVS